ncbi:hypothetical protein [Streptomyces cyaneochromogenes]|nr:hypothetical protein [Streptomyces cyaneochromogenes]
MATALSGTDFAEVPVRQRN